MLDNIVDEQTLKITEDKYVFGLIDAEEIIGICKIHGEIKRKQAMSITFPGMESHHCEFCYIDWIKNNITELDKK